MVVLIFVDKLNHNICKSARTSPVLMAQFYFLSTSHRNWLGHRSHNRKMCRGSNLGSASLISSWWLNRKIWEDWSTRSFVDFSGNLYYSLDIQSRSRINRSFFDIAEKILINNGALYPYNENYRGNWAFLKGSHSWIAVMSQMALLQLQGSNTMPHMAEAEEMVWTLTFIR